MYIYIYIARPQWIVSRQFKEAVVSVAVVVIGGWKFFLAVHSICVAANLD